MKKILMLAVVIGLVTSGTVFADDSRLSFRGIFLGMSTREAEKLVQEYNEVGLSVSVSSCQDSMFNDIACGESKGKVWLITACAWNSDAERLKTTVFKKYGKPTRTWATDWKTLFGTNHKGLVAEWKVGKDVVDFEYKPTDIVSGELEWGGFLRIMSSEYLASLKKRDMKL